MFENRQIEIGGLSHSPFQYWTTTFCLSQPSISTADLWLAAVRADMSAAWLSCLVVSCSPETTTSTDGCWASTIHPVSSSLSLPTYTSTSTPTLNTTPPKCLCFYRNFILKEMQSIAISNMSLCMSVCSYISRKQVQTFQKFLYMLTAIGLSFVSIPEWQEDIVTAAMCSMTVQLGMTVMWLWHQLTGVSAAKLLFMTA